MSLWVLSSSLQVEYSLFSIQEVNLTMNVVVVVFVVVVVATAAVVFVAMQCYSAASSGNLQVAYDSAKLAMRSAG